MIYTCDSKITAGGAIISIFGVSNAKGQRFAGGKKYWIEYGRPSGRRAIYRSNSLEYIAKKFKEIS